MFTFQKNRLYIPAIQTWIFRYIYYTGIMKSLDYINVFIISDDIELVKREFDQYNIKQDNIVFVDNLDSHDFYIMYLSGIIIFTIALSHGGLPIIR